MNIHAIQIFTLFDIDILAAAILKAECKKCVSVGQFFSPAKFCTRYVLQSHTKRGGSHLDRLQLHRAYTELSEMPCVDNATGDIHFAASRKLPHRRPPCHSVTVLAVRVARIGLFEAQKQIWPFLKFG